MKKYLLLFALIIATCCTFAQTYNAIEQHDVGYSQIDLRNLMPMRDGSFLANCQLFDLDEQNNYAGDHGNKFIKISKQAEILDSICIEDHDLNYFLLEPNPFDNDYIYARAVRNLETQRCDLCISFFDDNLQFKPDKELWIPLCDTLFKPLHDMYLLDKDGDIIIQFDITSRNERHFFRIGIDGALKTHTVVPSNQLQIQRTGSLETFNAEEKEYLLWGFQGASPTDFRIVVLDSLFMAKKILIPETHSNNITWSYGYQDCVMDYDDNSFLVASGWFDSYTSGVRVTRYDKSTLEALGTRLFETDPTVDKGKSGCAFPIGLAKSGDGGFYFAYNTQNYMDRVSIVKMDADLEVVWQCFCLEPYQGSHEGTQLKATEDGWIIVGGINWGTETNLFFLVLHDERWTVDEATDNIRPYTFTNPISDAIHFLFSPNVQPESVELYDLQGRLVLTQQNALENIDVARLSPGVYSMRVLFKNGKCYAEKLVKQ